MTDKDKLKTIIEYLEDEWRNAERLRAGLQRYHFPEYEYEKANFYSMQVATIRNEVKEIVGEQSETI